MTVASHHLISVHPEDLKFQFELEKQSYCDLKVTNNTEHHIAFKVKTTSPKKYFVRPNTGVMHPWDSCVIRVTLQTQREYPPNMQCKDKFLLQSTVVPPNTSVDKLPQDTSTLLQTLIYVKHNFFLITNIILDFLLSINLSIDFRI
ncbi:hypothetical protein Pfo_010157 [Paulownia fortunei]|nr:hypothetical protein Pfo_010157 [Paulownia fortunei]